KITQLKPATFNYNDLYYQTTGYTGSKDRQITGFIAQELQQVFPEMVNTGKDGYLDTNLSNLDIYLVKAIQEQQSQIASLSAKINNESLTDTGDLQIVKANACSHWTGENQF
ncbi:MAG: tail fiber domain-containing protein, partial [Chloroflexi bacterium]|nr:tail fiber domain-containing protein [Chloroflexota bacterium]